MNWYIYRAIKNVLINARFECVVNDGLHENGQRSNFVQMNLNNSGVEFFGVDREVQFGVTTSKSDFLSGIQEVGWQYIGFAWVTCDVDNGGYVYLEWHLCFVIVNADVGQTIKSWRNVADNVTIAIGAELFPIADHTKFYMRRARQRYDFQLGFRLDESCISDKNTGHSWVAEVYFHLSRTMRELASVDVKRCPRMTTAKREIVVRVFESGSMYIYE